MAAKVDRDAAQDEALQRALSKTRAARKENAAAAIVEESAQEDKQKVTVYLPVDLVQRARGAVLYSQMSGQGVDSNSDLFQQAVEEKLDRLVVELKPEGGDFPRPKKKLSAGRPPKAK